MYRHTGIHVPSVALSSCSVSQALLLLVTSQKVHMWKSSRFVFASSGWDWLKFGLMFKCL